MFCYENRTFCPALNISELPWVTKQLHNLRQDDLIYFTVLLFFRGKHIPHQTLPGE